MGSEVGIVTKGNQSEKSEASCGLALKYELALPIYFLKKLLECLQMKQLRD